MSAQAITYQWLRKRIASMPRDSGGFITEAEVAEAAGTSRTPVREALLRLQAEGFLEIVPKKGAFVPAVSDAEVEAVIQARGLVEDWCVRRATMLGEELFTELANITAEQESLISDSVAFIECDRRFHRAIVRAAGNPLLADFFESLRERQTRMGVAAVVADEGRARKVLAEHTLIIEGMRSLDPDTAAKAVADHLMNTLSVLRRSSTFGWRSKD